MRCVSLEEQSIAGASARAGSGDNKHIGYFGTFSQVSMADAPADIKKVRVRALMPAEALASSEDELAADAEATEEENVPFGFGFGLGGDLGLAAAASKRVLPGASNPAAVAQAAAAVSMEDGEGQDEIVGFGFADFGFGSACGGASSTSDAGDERVDEEDEEDLSELGLEGRVEQCRRLSGRAPFARDWTLFDYAVDEMEEVEVDE